MKIVYTRHAQEVASLRGISESLVERCVQKPDKVFPGRDGKVIYLKDFGKNYLRVVASKENSSIFVITLHWLEKKRIQE